MGFRVWGCLGFRVFGVSGVGFRVWLVTVVRFAVQHRDLRFLPLAEEYYGASVHLRDLGWASLLCSWQHLMALLMVYITLRTLNYGNFGTFLTMGTAGFVSDQPQCPLNSQSPKALKPQSPKPLKP